MLNMQHKEILGFVGEYAFLSNFWPCQIEFEGLTFPSVEHAYVAAKSFDLVIRRKVQQLKYPGQVKKFGRSFTLRCDWEDVKLPIMYELVYQKFSKNENLKEKLLQTGNSYLEETNSWKDIYWGVYNGIGQNLLGNNLMEVREKLK